MKRTARGVSAGSPGARVHAAAWALALALTLATAVRADEPYAPSRDYDLQNARISLRFDTAGRKVFGEVTHTLAALREGLTKLEFDSVDLTIGGVTVGGKPAKFETAPGKLRVMLERPAQRGEKYVVSIRYEGKPKKGLYFVLPDKDYPSRPRQVWTQGEAQDTRYYIPIYDYPNDMTTTQMILTVPADWTTVSNGKLVSVKPAANGMKTWDWVQSKPHSTYLISVVAGEFDQARDTWRGIPLLYLAPKGRGNRIPPTFGNTKQMLDFFSDKLGVLYPWVKYAQSTVDDFVAGGMENTSATTNASESLVDPRLAGEYLQNADPVNSHELAHQWFGDLVTCKDWAHLWLNEGFATYFETLWVAHNFGADVAAYENWRAQDQWRQQANLYPVPIITRNFSDAVEYAGNVYGKGGLVLHMLHQQLGDPDFFRGLKHYLEKHRHQNVVTADLIRAIEEATGKNMDQFFDQWVYGAGAPRFEISYAWEEAAKTLKLEVRQTQKVEGSVGLFRVPVDVEITTAAGKKTHTIAVSQASETFTFPVEQKPLMVLFDPENIILKFTTFKKDWKDLTYQLKNAATIPARADAARALREFRSNDDAAAALGEAAVGDKFWGVRVQAIQSLGTFGTPAAQKQIRAALANQQPWVRQPVVDAMGRFKDDPAVGDLLLKVWSEDKAYRVRSAALTALARQKVKGASDVLRQATATDSPNEMLRAAALRAMGVLGDDKAVPVLLEWSAVGKPLEARSAAINSLGRLDKKNKEVTRKLVEYLGESRSLQFGFGTFSALIERGDLEALPALEKWAARDDLPIGTAPFVQAQLTRLKPQAAAKKDEKPAAPVAAAGASSEAPGAGNSAPGMGQMGQQILQAIEKLQAQTAEMNERLKKLEAKVGKN